MDLTSKYPGIELKNPIIMGAGNLVTDINMLQSPEEAGGSSQPMQQFACSSSRSL